LVRTGKISERKAWVSTEWKTVMLAGKHDGQPALVKGKA
jgi:hypothetical protein